MAKTAISPMFKIRHDLQAARSIVAGLFPRESDRNVALKILSDAIRIAARVAPESWSITLDPQRLCLNVGGLAVLQLNPDEILLTVTGRLLKDLPVKQRSTFRFNQEYKFVPDSIEGRLSTKAFSSYRFLATAHADLIKRAAQKRRISFYKDSHSPSVVELLRDRGLLLVEPDQATVSYSNDAKSGIVVDVDDMEPRTSEGRRILRTHLVRERNPALVRKKKERVLAATGRLACEICRFDFERFYGSLGHAFAEVHHLHPLGTSAKVRHVSFNDLAVVCSNCHRMLHRGNPILTLGQLRNRLERVKALGKL